MYFNGITLLLEHINPFNKKIITLAFDYIF